VLLVLGEPVAHAGLYARVSADDQQTCLARRGIISS
jgi:hypothetical protein